MGETELRKKIVEKLDSLDWSQLEFGIAPSEDEFVDALLDLYRENEREIRLDEIKRVNSLTLSPLPITTSREIYIQKYAEQRIAMLSNTHKTGNE